MSRFGDWFALEARKVADFGTVAQFIEALDRRMENRITIRGMLAQAFDFKRRNEIRGDYFEFGLWRGASFRIAHTMKRRYRQADMRLWGFDSFQGLPEPLEKKDNVWHKGEFAFSEQALRNLLRRSGIGEEEYELIPGFYDQSLNAALHERLGGRQAAIVLVDCDLYESTVPVLEFIHRYLQNGTVLCFDDYYGYRACPNLGEQRAIREFLAAHSDVALLPYMDFSPIGKSFIVQLS